MYTHQIIETVAKIKSRGLVENDEYWDFVLGSLLSCSGFDFGEIDSLMDIFNRSFSGKECFNNDLSVGPMPYNPTCLFVNHVVSGKSNKMAFLVSEIEGERLAVQPFLQNDKADWIPEPYPILIEHAFDKSHRCKVHTVPIDNTMLSMFPTGYKRSDEWVAQAIRFINCCLILLNTKNIVHERVDPPAKLVKSRIKKGKQPPLSYHVLKLQLPASHTKGGKGTGENTGLTRLHLCRGHFKTYTEENPLFGKCTGRYWWQPHARGDHGNGVIEKDYKVAYA